MSNRTLEVGACGWQHSSWDTNFYPEDLPEDWRLDYYSHNYNVLLMPVADWQSASVDDVEQWLSDVKSNFDFFLSINEMPNAAQLKQLEMLQSMLTDKLAGIVWQYSCDYPVFYLSIIDEK